MTITKNELKGHGLAKLINNADSDDRLREIVSALRHFGFYVPEILLDLE